MIVLAGPGAAVSPGIATPGESLANAQERVQAVLAKVHKKHKDGVVALIVPEPLTSVVRSVLKETALDDLWKAECDTGGWEVFQLEPGRHAVAT